MANISCTERARKLLQYCLDGSCWPKRLLYEIVDECPDDFFKIVVERLADLFEPRLCDTYAALFSETIEHTMPELRAASLVERYERVRRVRACKADAKNVFVLSRVTLGADIKVTSIILDAVKRRFPRASIFLVGSEQSALLFARDERIQSVPVSYPRGGPLSSRLRFWTQLRERLAVADSIVIDPDSRLTQLGLLPVCAEEDYFFFESRAYGGDGDDNLSALTERWVRECFGVEGCAAYLSPSGFAAERTDRRKRVVSVSFGTGGNDAKRIGGPFESELLKLVASRGATIWIDQGAGGEEARRVHDAVVRSGLGPDQVHEIGTAFAGFAALAGQTDLYAGYDSAGQHAAAAYGVPLVSIFAGYPSERMFQRWRPSGSGKIEIVKVENPDPYMVLEQVEKRLDSLMP